MEPLADPGAHDDHRPAAGLLGVVRELPGDPDHLRGAHPGDRLLPGRRVRVGVVVIAGGPVAGQSVPGDPVLREHQVEHRAAQLVSDPAHRDTAGQHLGMAVGGVEPGQLHRDRACSVDLIAENRELRHDLAQVQVPFADAGIGVPETQRPVRHDDLAGAAVQQRGFERRAFAGVAQVGGGEVLPGHVGAVVFVQPDQERQVGVLLDVVDKERRPPVDQELATG